MSVPAAPPEIAYLKDRGVLGVTGADAHKFLQGLISNDMDQLQPGRALHAALLTPQGKILFDFLVIGTADGYLLEVAKDKAAELAKRLTFYKLRAQVTIEDLSERLAIIAAWDGALPSAMGHVRFADPRLAALGSRIVANVDQLSTLLEASGGVMAADTDYHAHRIALGVPEGGRDYPFGDAFPHEANLDQLHGISLTKGCYVGQEIVSRMEHRGTARKRIVPVHAIAPLPASGADIKIGEAVIGRLGSVAGRHGLAMVRLDRAAEAGEKGQVITAGDVPVTITKPSWATFPLDPRKSAAGGA